MQEYVFLTQIMQISQIIKNRINTMQTYMITKWDLFQLESVFF